MRPRILFVCSRNQWRSPTAEAVYRNDSRLEVRLAGVSASARHVISTVDIDWADLILVMAPEHKQRIREQFRGGELPPIECLDIPDDYRYMDTELQQLIRQSTEPWINQLLS
ncbi:low molecular weight protein tyrosine phosphatase family protein [Cerasicoccus fimbriatus]|uniref:low molecular weight protein tyrosine phosphatase family protein n=1 Tax=Cerasicoccus fimbriatus TaxID=3014554 RepID=UPI0022B47D4A|nr:hypothetical protein [Cerasicoccus sp. TK19100]